VNDEPEPDWFHGTKAQHRRAQGDFAPLTDPHAPWRDQRDVIEGWFADILPDMNQENPAVAKYLIQNAVWWIEETGADGLRIDTFPYVGRQFWSRFHKTLHRLYPKLTTVGEVFNPDATIVSSFAGGVTRNGVDTGLDTPFDFPSYFALREVFAHDAPMSKLPESWRLDALYPHPEQLVPFLGNHDVTRFLSENGATPQRLKLAFAVLLTMRGMPEIYSGDEIGMRGGEDPDNRRDFPGGFSGEKQNAFIDDQRTLEQKELHDWVQKLLTLRKENPSIQVGQQQVITSTNDVLLYVRNLGRNRIIVGVNKGREASRINIEIKDTALQGCHGLDSLMGNRANWSCTEEALQGMIEPESVWVARVR
jgi:glycosidase